MRRISFSLLVFVFFIQTGVLMADDGTEKNADARFRLGAEIPNGTVKPERTLTEHDFSWEMLTERGPASGAEPKIGDESYASYYDFKDGLPHPYYVVKR